LASASAPGVPNAFTYCARRKQGDNRARWLSFGECPRHLAVLVEGDGVVALLANVYIHTPNLEEGAEPQDPWVDPDEPEWTAAEMEVAYTELMAMFLYYAKEIEAHGAPGLLEHLQRQAVVNALDDGPPPA
jgi:hypothetical protein